MNKAILLSIKPKWVAKILNGEKTIEVRKTMFKCDLPIDVYIYCTKDNRGDNDSQIILGNTNYSVDLATRVVCGKGKVVAKFTLRKVEEIFTPSYITEDDNDYSCDIDELLKQSCLTEEELTNYIGEDNYHFYAYHIEDLVIFDKPKELSEFRRPPYCDCKLRCDNNLEHSFCREVCSHNLDNERLSVCCDRDGWVKGFNTGSPYLTKAPQNFCYVETEE